MNHEAVYRTAPATPGLLIIEDTHSQKSGRGHRSDVIIILLKLFFFQIPDHVHRRTLAPVAAGNCR